MALYTPSAWFHRKWSMVQFEPALSRKNLKNELLVVLSWLAVTGVGLALTPSVHGHGTHQQLGLPPCGSVLLFGRMCPGCGLTTSWTAVLKGDFSAAFAANWLGPVLYLAFTVAAIVSLYGFAKKLHVSTTHIYTYVVGVLLTLLAVYGIWRFATSPRVPHYERPIFPFMAPRR